jgi:hypothetical protein
VAAPVASGWSFCRVGFTPTGKRRLVTAHTRSGRLANGRSARLLQVSGVSCGSCTQSGPEDGLWSRDGMQGRQIRRPERTEQPCRRNSGQLRTVATVMLGSSGKTGNIRIRNSPADHQGAYNVVNIHVLRRQLAKKEPDCAVNF